MLQKFGQLRYFKKPFFFQWKHIVNSENNKHILHWFREERLNKCIFMGKRSPVLSMEDAHLRVNWEENWSLEGGKHISNIKWHNSIHFFRGKTTIRPVRTTRKPKKSDPKLSSFRLTDTRNLCRPKNFSIDPGRSRLASHPFFKFDLS